MNNAVNFLLESGVSLSVLSLFYILFLRKETFLRLNRVFLLISLAFSVVLPFLHFGVYAPKTVVLSEVTVTPYRNLVEAVTVYGKDFSGTVVNTIISSRLIVIVYFLGVVFFLGLLILRSIQIIKLVRDHRVKPVGFVKFVYIPEQDFSPFSFLGYIFVNPEKMDEPGYDKMVAHEMEHIKQGHTIDVLILEIMTVLQWFNPFMWILKRVIRENHEFLADKAVLDSGISPAQYKHLLLNQAVGLQLEMANNFNSSLIKNRIQMISKIRSSKYGKLKVLFGLLLIFGLTTAFAFEEKKNTSKKKEKTLILNLDDQIARNTEELQHITGIVDEYESSKDVLEKLKEEYSVDYRYGVYGVKWKRDYKNGIFFIDGKEATYEEVEKLEKKNCSTGIGYGREFKPFLEKYGERAKNGVNFIYNEIQHDNLFPRTVPVKASDVELTVQEVLDKYYEKPDVQEKVDGNPPVVVNVDGKQMVITGDDVCLADVRRLLKCNDHYEISILPENNIINLKSKMKLGKRQVVEEVEGEPVFFVVEDMPEFPGGDLALRKYIANSIKYPVAAQQNGIQGKVYINFIVGKDGKVKNTRIARGVDPNLDKEAARVVRSLPLWKPGKQRGEAVNVSYTVPITFALQDNQPKVVEVLTTVNTSDERKTDEDQVFFIVEDMPEFPGGELALREYIANRIKYPVAAQVNGIQGKVYVKFVIGKDGQVKNERIARGVDPALDKEALRVIGELPKWKPGKQRGKAVNVSYTVPITFALQNNSPKVVEIVEIQSEKEKNSNEVFFIVEDMPEFPGGEEALRNYIANMIKYPEVAHEEGIQGKVYVTFTVGKDGKVKDARIARGVDPSLDKEALRVVNMLPLWKPGKQRGKAVNVAYTVPINFELNGPPKIKNQKLEPMEEKNVKEN